MDNTYHQITLNEYMDFKQQIADKLNNMAADYITIGYLLKRIRDTEGFKQDGYSSLQEFAKREYGLSESAVSRFISINTKFSVDGNTPILQDEFKNFGSSKLSEMLTLSDEDCKLITEKTTVATIRDLKKLNSETVEADVVSSEPKYSSLENIIIEFFRNKKDLLNKIYIMSDIEDIAECINPSGNLTYKHKASMLFMFEDKLKLKRVGELPTEYTWDDFVETTVNIYRETYTDHDTVWQNFYKIEAELLEQEELENAKRKKASETKQVLDKPVQKEEYEERTKPVKKTEETTKNTSMEEQEDKVTVEDEAVIEEIEEMRQEKEEESQVNTSTKSDFEVATSQEPKLFYEWYKSKHNKSLKDELINIRVKYQVDEEYFEKLDEYIDVLALNYAKYYSEVTKC